MNELTQTELRATQRLIDWAFGPGLMQVRSVLGSDPVVRFWIGMRQPPLARLSVLFDEGNGAATCAACTKCCKSGVRWVVQAAHVLMWPLLSADRYAPHATEVGHCLFLGDRGCTLTSAARPALCSTFTCDELDAAMGPRLMQQIDIARTPLHRVERAVLSYLSQRYAVVGHGSYFGFDAAAVETAPFFDRDEPLRIAVLDGPLKLEHAVSPRKRGIFPSSTPPAPSEEAPAPVAPEADDFWAEAQKLLDDRATEKAARLTHARALIEQPALTVPPAFAEIVRAMHAAKQALLDAQERYAKRHCSICPQSGGPIAPRDKTFADHRRRNTLRLLQEGSFAACMYTNCASGSALDVSDVAAWKVSAAELGRRALPVLDGAADGCPAIAGEGDCSQDPLARSPACDRFLCPREPAGAGDTLRSLERHYKLLFNLVREVAVSATMRTDYDGPSPAPAPLL